MKVRRVQLDCKGQGERLAKLEAPGVMQLKMRRKDRLAHHDGDLFQPADGLLRNRRRNGRARMLGDEPRLHSGRAQNESSVGELHPAGKLPRRFLEADGKLPCCRAGHPCEPALLHGVDHEHDPGQNKKKGPQVQRDGFRAVGDEPQVVPEEKKTDHE